MQLLIRYLLLLQSKTIISAGYNIGFKSLNVPVIAAAELPPPGIDEEVWAVRPAPSTALTPAAEPATVLVRRSATTSVAAFDTISPSFAVKDNY